MKHSTLQTKPRIIFNRWKTAVTLAQGCDGELPVWQLLSAFSETKRQMEAEWHSPTSHFAGIRARVKLGKSRIRHFQVTWSIWKNWVSVIWTPLTGKREKRERTITFLPTNDSKCWSSHIFIFLCSVECLMVALYALPGRKKGGEGVTEELGAECN